MLMRMPVSISATRVGNGNLRCRENAVGCSECRAVRRNSVDCNCTARSIKSVARDMRISEVKNLTGGAARDSHVKLFIEFEPYFLSGNLNLGGLTCRAAPIALHLKLFGMRFLRQECARNQEDSHQSLLQFTSQFGLHFLAQLRGVFQQIGSIPLLLPRTGRTLCLSDALHSDLCNEPRKFRRSPLEQNISAPAVRIAVDFVSTFRRFQHRP